MYAEQVIIESAGHVSIERVDVPPPEPGEVTVQLDYTVISPGTELAILNGLMPNWTDGPVGYSGAGRVVAAGDGVALSVGDRVAVQAYHAAVVTVSQALCHRLPDGVDMLPAAAYRLASIAAQGVRKGQVQLGETVGIVGLGVIGHLAGQLAWIAGAGQLIGIDPLAWRCALAERAGFTRTYASADAALADAPDGCPLVIEATGVPEPVNDALRLAARRGRVVLQGSTRGSTREVDFYQHVHRKGVQLIGAHDTIRPQHEDFPSLATHATDARTVLAFIADRRLRPEPVISDVVPGPDAAAAYRRLDEREEGLMTIALDWREQGR